MTERETRKIVAEDERLQPDPELGLSGGKARTGQIVSALVAAAAVLAILFYGLTRESTSPNVAKEQSSGATTSAPASPQGNTGSAPAETR